MDEDDLINRHESANTSPPGERTEHEDLPPPGNRVFLNHVDQYNARHIAEYLTDQTMGALKNAREELEGEGADDEEEQLPTTVPTNLEKYECIGTMKYRFGHQTEDIAYTVSEADVKILEKEILRSGFVIYDITNDPAEIPKALNALNIIINDIESVKDIGPKTYKRYSREYVFILISNILTWGKTKPVDRDDPEVPFTEADYKKRKAHPNYKEQIACEREVVLKGRKYKGVLKTYVLCCGIPYGFEEDNLLLFFKMAWENKDLPIFVPGNNFIPLVHIQDVAKVIYAILELKPKKQYILVVEQIPARLGRIMRAIATTMGQGVKEIVKEEAFLYNAISQKLFDILTINLKMEPAYILDELGLEYRSDLNLVQNINKIVMEFRDARNLIPMRVLVHGPVASGRTNLSKHLEDYYGLHYVNVGRMIEETRQALRNKIDAEIESRKAKESKANEAEDPEDVEDEGGEETPEEYEPIVNLGALQDQLKVLETTLENNANILPDDYVMKMMRQFLASNICQNQGYILDAFPKTMEQCRNLFAPELDGHFGGEGGEDMDILPGRSITPQFVISLEADNDYLIDVMMNYPETGDQKLEEENMLQRLKFFRDNNTEDNTLLNFFDEHEIHPTNINITILDDVKALFEKVHEALGPPFGFEATGDEQEEIFRCRQDAEKLKLEQEEIEKELLERGALEEYQQKMEERIRVLDELQKEEEKLITVQCEPMRHYLMTHVFPTLTQGLLEVARIKPNDPIDYLAEYLFKFNPEGKMFDPTYTRRGEHIQNETKDTFVQKTTLKRLEESCKT